MRTPGDERQHERLQGPPRVVLAVLTFRRPEDLSALLPMLQAQAGTVGGAAAGGGVDLLVVDNDPDAGAAHLVAGFAGVRYAHEPQPGIAAARNRALDEAAEHDLLIFIDDDERPCQGWLSAMLGTHRAYRACGVVGPVVSSFAAPLEHWVSAGGFFDRRRMPTGSRVSVAATNNLLVELSTVRAARLRFDDRLGLSGGSDTLFTRRLVAEAGPLIWCDEAVVTDVVPASRSTRGWVLRRQLRSGNSWSRTALMLPASPAQRLRLRLELTAMAGVRLIAGPAQWVLGLLTGSVRRRAVGAKALARGAGLLLGAYGVNYVEYRRKDRTSSPLTADAFAQKTPK